MTKYAIFFDIDGTIIDENSGIIPASCIEGIKQAQKNGHMVFINTGRPFPAIDTCIKDIGFDGYVCGCGTYVKYRGQELLQRTLGNELSQRIVVDLLDHNIDGILEGHQNIYYRNQVISEAVGNIKERHQSMDTGFLKGWEDEKISFDKLAIWTLPESNFQGFEAKYKDTFEFIHRDICFYELVPHGYSKATGIQFLEKHLNIDHCHTIAIGDSTNDISMLGYVGISIAMGNSNPILFEQVNYVTKDIMQDGVYWGLKQFQII
ncbi:Cof-type HAD-IIB family hydrolase [Anaeromicropila populeti]|uniref:Cof subfamily of IIB subfamily of haloacid dehalogenase superfamily/HAD-superfamily hydrolase, subfamily IIB n=1 Tax=Anaeromicropila populeti TaxID=37658 RepID=A0A1I6JM81_9FIRM|nr:HAD family hydrolase [Anaeromicropila populeti]SFR80073.1 hypothetical protein SAMN05661086_01755 [Anaeromicropila populeti]